MRLCAVRSACWRFSGPPLLWASTIYLCQNERVMRKLEVTYAVVECMVDFEGVLPGVELMIWHRRRCLGRHGFRGQVRETRCSGGGVGVLEAEGTTETLKPGGTSKSLTRRWNHGCESINNFRSEAFQDQRDPSSLKSLILGNREQCYWGITQRPTGDSTRLLQPS